MDNSTIQFGTKQYYSLLSPLQIQREIQSLIMPKRWLRNPFTSPEKRFEGTVDADRFRLTYSTLVQSNRPFPVIEGQIVATSDSRTEVNLKLTKSPVEVFIDVFFGFLTILLLIIVMAAHAYILIGFAIVMGVIIIIRRLPNQHFSAEILTILKQQLQLTPAPDSSIG